MAKISSRLRTGCAAAALAAAACSCLPAQSTIPDGALDPTRHLSAPAAAEHAPLPEQYIWTSGDVTALRPDRNKFPWNARQLRVAPHFFRARFAVQHVPRQATLYIAGPRSARAYLNGRLVGEFASDIDQPIGFHVFRANVSGLLRSGENVLAIQAVRGRGIVTGAGSRVWQQLAYGEVLAAKIVPAAPGMPAAPGVDGAAIVVSNQDWKSSADAPQGWQQKEFDDAAWKPVESLGPVEGNVDLFQWNADAGMYDWPGYMGMSPWLRAFRMKAASVSHVFSGQARFAHLDALTAPPVADAAAAGTAAAIREDAAAKVALTSNAPPRTFTVATGAASSGEATPPPDSEQPALLLDFGREVAGRLLVESACDCETVLSVAYGESEEEAMNSGVGGGHMGGNYVGVNLLRVPPRGIVRGPKSAFRYARIRFLRGAASTGFRWIGVEGIYYPVRYQGAFESSDPLLNRIWETGAYTAHLCMQDGVWDAPKRDRGRWVGDMDIADQTISDVFADRFLIEDTLARLYPADSARQQVNGIVGYSALWVSAMANLYRHSGDKAFVAKEHDALLGVLGLMDGQVDERGLLANKGRKWLFVDWSPGLYGDNAETRAGTQLEFCRAYRDAAFLLRETGDSAAAAKYQRQSERLLAAAREHLADSGGGTYGTHWQINAMAVVSGAAPQQSYPAIWDGVLSHVGSALADAQQGTPEAQVVSPYFNDYVLNAMAEMGHRDAALAWMKQYWGGMLAEGATSFWESYDLRWPKNEPHLSLQADGTSGYFVSLAHGWSSGPTVWLMEQMLGITPDAPGFRKVHIRPDLMGVAWAKGQQPTPQGAIRIDIEQKKAAVEITLDLPDGEAATVSVPLMHPGARVLVNGVETASVPAEGASRGVVALERPGHYTLTSR